MSNYPKVCIDHNRHTCIALSENGGDVSFIPMDASGFVVASEPAMRFNGIYKEADYPVEKAAKLFAEYAANLGGTKEAILALASLTPMTKKEIEMATSKKIEKPAKPAATEKSTIVKKPVAKSTAAKKPVAKSTAAKVKKEPSEKKPSASMRFKELILEGTLSDDKIFAKVQKEFGLDDSKRGYVKWYRNDLVKKGVKVPKIIE